MVQQDVRRDSETPEDLRATSSCIPIPPGERHVLADGQQSSQQTQAQG